MDLALYKEFYQQEWQRHEHLQSAVNTPISIVTLLAGGLVLMGKGFETMHPALAVSFWSTATFAAGLVVAAVFLLIRSIHGYDYKRLPFTTELANHHRTLVEHYEGRGAPRLAAETFEEYLAKLYAVATDHNRVNNTRRDDYLSGANRFVVYALCATTLSAIPAGVAAKTAPVRPQEVRITNPGSDAHESEEQRNAGRSGIHPAKRPPRSAPGR
ncbi:MAG TPA: hypothetical protein VJT67_14125 [Longimicrobiaceae bacterium]|nr:hypothetical protein [Longimicrobiaceae bacterium]